MSQRIYEYMCDICHDISSGIEIEIEDTNKHLCSAGHTFCHEHINTELITLEQLHQVITDYCYSDGSYNEVEEISGEVTSNQPVDSIISNVFNYSFDAADAYHGFSNVFCPICNLQQLTNEQLLQYLLIKYKTSKEAITREIKNSFKDSSGLDLYLDANKGRQADFLARIKPTEKKKPDIIFTKFSAEQKMLVILYALINEDNNRLYEHSLNKKTIDNLLVSFLDYAETEHVFGLEGLEDIFNGYFPSYKPEEKLYELKRRLLLNDLE